MNLNVRSDATVDEVAEFSMWSYWGCLDWMKDLVARMIQSGLRDCLLQGGLGLQRRMGRSMMISPVRY